MMRRLSMSHLWENLSSLKESRSFQHWYELCPSLVMLPDGIVAPQTGVLQICLHLILLQRPPHDCIGAVTCLKAHTVHLSSAHSMYRPALHHMPHFAYINIVYLVDEIIMMR